MSRVAILFEHLGRAFDVFNELQQDVLRCDTELRRLYERFPDPTLEQRNEGQFWLRTSIRSFFSLVEGVAYTMRQSALELHESQYLDLSLGEQVLLREKNYQWQKGRVQEREGYSKTLEGIQMAFTLFPRAFGANFSLEASGHRYDAFRKALGVRHSLTHPKCKDDLFLSTDQLQSMSLAVAWFVGQMESLRESCRKQLEAINAANAESI